METSQANHRVYFPRRATEIRNAPSSRKQAPGVMGSPGLQAAGQGA